MIGTLLLAAALGATVPQAAQRTIADANQAWLEAMKRQDAAGVAAPYADDAVFVTPTGETLHGRAAIEAFHRERFQKSARVIDGQIADDGMTLEGQLVYEWGHATLRVAGTDGKTTSATGRFLTVWSPDASGRWRIIRNLSLP
jgi:uncharacterized protein (TIGR02246 family)